MKAEELRALLAVLIEAAPGLRAAGVTQLEHDGFQSLKFSLAPPPTTVVIPQRPPVPEHEKALEAVAALAKSRGAASR
jgi:hypothetical protein